MSALPRERDILREIRRKIVRLTLNNAAKILRIREIADSEDISKDDKITEITELTEKMNTNFDIIESNFSRLDSSERSIDLIEAKTEQNRFMLDDASNILEEVRSTEGGKKRKPKSCKVRKSRKSRKVRKSRKSRKVRKVRKHEK